MVAKHKALAEIVKADPAVATFSHSVGVTGSNQTIANGRFWIALKDRGDRDVSASQFIDRIRSKLAKVPGIVLYLRAGQDINLSSGPSRAQYQYVLKSNDGATLNTWTQRLTEKLRANPAFRDLSNDLQLGGSITHISIDRQAAARFGLTATDVDQALYDAFGQRQINEFQTEINQYQVVLELDTQQRGKAESLNYFYLRSPLTNEMVPLSALAKVDPPTVGPLSISHDGMFPAANLSFNLAPGVALGDAVDHAQPGQERNRHAGDHHRQLPGRGPGVPEFAGQPAVADPRGAGGGVHHPRGAVRELRAPADDHFHLALGRLGRVDHVVAAGPGLFDHGA